jgi:hypothetical protein
MALDLLSLDTAFEGQPFADTGRESSTSLDLAFEGQPFTCYGGAVVDATVTTSQAQHAIAAPPVVGTVATSQGQSSAAIVGLGWNVTATTSQGQSAQAQAKAHTPWQLVTAAHGDSRNADPTIPAFTLASGNHVVVSVFCGAYTNRADGTVDMSTSRAWTLAVSDSAGNTYVGLTPVRDQVVASPQFSVSWLYQFYCVNAVGSAANTVTVTPVSGPSDAYSSASPTLVSSVSVLSSSGVSAEFDAIASAGSSSNNAVSLSLPATAVQPGATVLFDFAGNGNNTESAGSGWTAADNYIDAWFTYWRPNNQPATQTVTVTGNGGIRLLSGLSLRNAQGIVGTTRQGQTSNASVEAITTVITSSATTAQGQHGAATGATAADTTVGTAQGQHTAASSGATLQATGTTAQAQAASALAGLFQPASSGTAQAQAASAQANVAVDGATATAQVQQGDAQGELSLDVAVTASQAQQQGAVLDTGAALSVQTSAVQQAAGQLASAYVADVLTAQEQDTKALAGVAIAAQVGSAQAQGASADAATGADAAVATRQYQRVRAQARAESENTTETGQTQRAVGQLGLSSDAPAATMQGQHADLLAGVASDVQATTGQAEHIGDGNILVVGVVLGITTTQAAQHTKGALAQYAAQPGTLSLATKRLHLSLAGSAQAQPALQAPNRVRTALGGRVDLRPER